ncbi:MAG: hypothetical protein E7643_06340 [Ruminococcaceae bacterium]|nr:hypothetical protein [Oscillospiraceae bacterium]
MTSNATIVKCELCGARMKQVGADGAVALYHCPSCGNDATVKLEGGNADFLVRKTELLVRASKGIAEWDSTQWDYLKKDLLDFMARYEDAKADLRMQMSVLACVTHGFHYITEENYKECKTLYKLTEKMYKILLRELKQTPDTGTLESTEDYKKNRALYRKCINDYRNTKLAWKLAFSVVKKFIPIK